MKKSMVSLALSLALGLGMTGETRADDRAWAWSPLGIGIVAPAQLPFMDSDVYGLRLGGLFGCNRNVYGLDIGFAEVCASDFIGLQGSAFSWTEGNVYGVQLGALANVADNRMYALQLGSVNAVWGDAVGCQLGLVNYTTVIDGVQVGGIINWNSLEAYGLQLGLVNANQGAFIGCSLGALVNNADSLTGFGLGLFNMANNVTGCQIGLVNACEKMHGVQIGFINLICDSKLPIMLLANASF